MFGLMGAAFDHESEKAKQAAKMQQEAIQNAMINAQYEQFRKAHEAKASKDAIDGEYEVVREVKGVEYVGR